MRVKRMGGLMGVMGGLLMGLSGCGGGSGTAANGVHSSGASAVTSGTTGTAKSGSGTAATGGSTATGGSNNGSNTQLDVPPLPQPAPIGARYWLGANYAWWNYATDFGTGGWNKYTDWNSIESAFADMHASGVRVARWWVFGDGRYSPDFNADGTVSGLDSQFFTDIDRALKMAARQHVYLIPTLVDFLAFNAPYAVNGVQLSGHANLLTDANAQQSYLDKAVRPLAQHIAASPYRSSVLAYDVCNEPEGAMAGYWGGANVDTPTMQRFVGQSAQAIHSADASAWVTVGSAQPGWVHLWQNLGLDFYQIHYYANADTNGPGSGLPSCASLKLDKPCIVGEFPSADASYGLNDTAPLSAHWYLNTIHDLGYAGALTWSRSVGDGASNWSAFAPVLQDWALTHQAELGP